MTQASNFFPESLEPASAAPTDPHRSPETPHLSDPNLSDNADLMQETPEVLKRPESVIFLIFISLLLFWDAYVDFIEDSFALDKTAISASQLARRLKISRKTIRRRKREPDFETWSQSLDPDGIGWTYRKGYYFSSSNL